MLSDKKRKMKLDQLYNIRFSSSSILKSSDAECPAKTASFPIAKHNSQTLMRQVTSLKKV
ncbi:MAG TPA: hypothetical protein VLA03_00815 [Draconibacterium sp.]|nr:hypothetical protein [Draconibacterium sp.]